MNFNSLPLLPGSCYPQLDELLSSWVSRLALNHGMAPLVFWQKLYPTATIEYRLSQQKLVDMDRYHLPELYNLLATRTATQPERVLNTTLWDYWLFTKGKAGWPTRRSLVYNWWLPISCPYATVVGFSFCARCLRKDGTHPYFRKSWRFSHTVACLDCGVLLANSCYRCLSAIDYRQLNANFSTQASLPDLAPNLAMCRSCGYDLAQTPVKSAAPVVLALQRRLYRIWQESIKGHKELYFVWLKSIIETLVAFNRYELREVVSACFLVRNSPGEQSLDEFENLGADLRARLLYQAMVFLGGGWEEFCQFYARYAHKYTPICYSVESPMFGFLHFLSKSMPSDWMTNWSSSATDIRDP